MIDFKYFVVFALQFGYKLLNLHFVKTISILQKLTKII